MIFFYALLIIIIAQIGLASYHVMIEKNIVEETHKCSTQDLKIRNQDPDDIRNIIMNSTPKSCKHATYIIPFLSLAELNILYSTILLIFIYKRKKNVFTR
jgi:disulfide bond formation protein DsbB